jgi:ubiquitin thioesterase protein OTUB1
LESVRHSQLTSHRGHYDILYKAEDFPPQIQQPVPAQAPLHVALAGYDDFVPMSSNMSDVMTMIPGMYPTGIGQRWPSVSYDHYASPAPQPQCTPVQSYATAPTPPVSVTSSHQEYATPVHASHSSQHHPASQHTIHLEPPVTLPIHPAPSAPPMSTERRQPMTIERSGPFRSSLYELEPDYGIAPVLALPFQTSIFRK